jgi:hypothetical protein
METPEPPGPEQVDRLTPDLGGRWLVRSRRSEHLFDLDTWSYQRTGEGRSFEHDGRSMSLTRVERWPAVGEVFFIWLDDPDIPDELEYWRQSSPIRSITRISP